jgi:hypothetical protein
MRWNNPDWAVKEKAIYWICSTDEGNYRENSKEIFVDVLYEVERNRCIWQDREEKYPL